MADEKITKNGNGDFEITWNNSSFILKKNKKSKQSKRGRKTALEIEKQLLEEKELEIDIGIIRKLYEAIETRSLISVNAIKCLEKITRLTFKNASDLRKQMKEFLEERVLLESEISEIDLENWDKILKSEIKKEK